MNSRNPLASSLTCALAAIGIISASELALAQTQTAAEITITGERSSKIVGRSTIGAPIEELTLSRKVSFSDLDLTSSAGASELEKRVNETAKDLCAELDKLRPLEPATGRDCVKKTSEPALAQAHAAITAAQQRLAGVGTKK